MASLKKALSKAEHKAALELKERKKQEARLGEVQEELQELGKKLESAERELKAKEAKKIAAGKKFFMQSKHAEEAFLLLTQIRSSPGAFAVLPCSVSDTAEFYRA